jgi:hypothetical protein
MTYSADESYFESEARTELAAVLDAVVEYVRRYVVVSEPQAATAALWVAHTHAIDAFETTPYLSITSAAKRSGKSKLLEVLALLVARPLRAAGVTEAALFRSIEDRRPTILMDEVDAIFGPKAGANHEDLRALLNAGFQLGTPVLRCVGDGSKQTVTEFAVFCPKALAGIGRLPDTIADRSISIRLKRRAPGETVMRLRRREAAEAAEPLHQALVAIMGHHVDQLAEARPELPEALDDRAADGWEPLLAIADLAGGGWPKRGRSSALALAQTDDDEDELGIHLLNDVKQAFRASGVERISTADLLAALIAEEESPWADWHGRPLTARSLARFLSPHGIRSSTVRLDDETTAKGYKLEAFEDAWKRYVPEKLPQKVTSDTTRMGAGFEAISETSHELFCDGYETDAKPHEQSGVTDVTDRTPIPGDSAFPDYVDEAFQNGQLVESEWLERRKVHARVLA